MLAGALLFIGLGLTLLATTTRMYVQIGRGTLAPWNPTERLIVVGVYRHVRNPMITGVMCILFGEAVVFNSVPMPRPRHSLRTPIPKLPRWAVLRNRPFSNPSEPMIVPDAIARSRILPGWSRRS